MKNLILAAAMALTSLVPLASVAEAQSMQTTVQVIDHRPGHRAERPRAERPRHRRDCYTKTVKHREHGRTVVRKTRVCR